jgi:glycerol-3-phosphate acyltransferase PlsX
MRIALDAMGGDWGVDATVPAALEVLAKEVELELVLVGDTAKIEQKLRTLGVNSPPRLSTRHASQTIAMHELPSRAMRMRDSSMRVMMNCVKAKEIDACVSAGNTGALMAIARYVLKTLPGIDRPAIITSMPTEIGHTHMLDLGANVDLSAMHLFEFALMGSELTAAVDNNPNPRIGLLNIGEEEIKGNEQVKGAHKLLSESHLNYIGYVEGDDIYKGVADVIVCDGFVGNVALKSSEGVAHMIGYFVKESFNRNLWTRLAGLIAKSVLNDIRTRIDPRRYNGASLLGLQGIVIKSHGGADALAFQYAIYEAILEVQKNVPQRISSRLAELLRERQSG